MQIVSGAKTRCEAGRTTHLNGDIWEEQFFSAMEREQEISAGLLLDFRLQMRCSGANQSVLAQTKQRKY
jgi:hypothetical protein